MPSGRMIAGTLIALTVVAVFIGPLSSVTEGNTGDVEFDQSVTGDTSQYVEVEGVYEITGNYSVELSDGTSLTEGTDYEINQTDGTILAIDSTNVNDGDTLVVKGEYSATDGTTTTVATLVPLFAALLILTTIAVRVQRMM